MVNTRRMESIGSNQEITTKHRSRRGTIRVLTSSSNRAGSSSVSESEESHEEEEEEQEEDEEEEEEEKSWNQHRKSSSTKRRQSLESEPLSSRVRELRNRFVYSERKFSSRCLRSNELSSTSRKRIPLDERRSLTVYSSRNMHDDSDMYNANDSEEEIYSRSRRSRHQHLRSHMTRIQRRTALSLRPISQKCYADSDSEGHAVRRSQRKRNVQFENMSWLADDQMHKVGYPNLNQTSVGYSEDDSRDVVDHHDDLVDNNNTNTTKRNREVKNPKYLYDYETGDVSARRRRTNNNDGNKRVADIVVRNNNNNNNRRVESNDKENKKDNNLNNKTLNRNNKNINKIETNQNNDKNDDNDNEADDSMNIQENGLDNHHQDDVEEEEVEEEEDDVDVEEEEEEEKNVVVPTSHTKKMIINEKFSSRRRRTTRKTHLTSSSESESERKSYSLRNRTSIQSSSAPKTILRAAHAELTRRRRFTRHRKNVSTDNTNLSSTDSDVGGCSKSPKTSHTKHGGNEQRGIKSGVGGSKIIPIGPETLDTNIRFTTIGGLDGHIECLKEMILLPMLYPEVFQQFHIQPPRGVLFHGPPGTGKTLLARALANECSLSCKKVAFFMRKGADLLSKWIGESEKQLRLLFEQAAEMKPSIIFFDELDGLAPVRSSRQDQVHASIVSTLLALMDGLDNRGEVIVIGATNRIDAIDPALRRPGRFDRELYFPLPAKIERIDILKVHVSKWIKPPNEQLLTYLAETAVGYCGSDLRALCTEAVIQSLRRTYPQVYNSDYKLLLQPNTVLVEKIDFLRAKSQLIPASYRVTQGLGRKLSPIIEPLFNYHLIEIYRVLEKSFPHGLNSTLSKVKLSANIKPAQLLIVGENSGYGQTLHLAPALLYKMEHIHTYLLDLTILYKESGRSPEEICIQVFNEARRNVPSIIYIPSIENWWNLVNDTIKSILISQLSQLPPNIPILFLATADTSYDNLSSDVQNIFSTYRKEIYELSCPSDECRLSFFKPLLIDTCLKPPRSIRDGVKTPPPLPKAPTPPPPPITEEQAKKLYETEEHTLRELRIFLRDICKKLANNKLFYMFTKPVDTEEVPDYPTIIKQPMDLETMMTKVDVHRYECAKDFLNDIELICQNALEYNPAKTSADKQIRHRACSLRDYAYTLIKNEMDSDFEDKCQDISRKRLNRKASVAKYLPAYIHTPDSLKLDKNIQETDNNNKTINIPTTPTTTTTIAAAATNENKSDKSDEKISDKNSDNSSNKSGSQTHTTRKRKTNNWQRGYLGNRKRKKIEKTIVPEDKEIDDKISSDDSKLNGIETSSNEKVVLDDSNKSEENSLDLTTPLTINCDQDNQIKLSTINSPRRKLNDLMSPSELLDNPLEFDDVDQALNETIINDDLTNKLTVECPEEQLKALLDQAVKITSNSTVQSLLDLYNELYRIVKKYSNTHLRKNLPQELLLEMGRFERDQNIDSFNETINYSETNLTEDLI